MSDKLRPPPDELPSRVGASATRAERGSSKARSHPVFDAIFPISGNYLRRHAVKFDLAITSEQNTLLELGECVPSHAVGRLQPQWIS